MTPEQIATAMDLLAERRQLQTASDEIDAFSARCPLVTSMSAKPAPGHGTDGYYLPPCCDDETGRKIYAVIRQSINDRQRAVAAHLNQLGVKLI